MPPTDPAMAVGASAIERASERPHLAFLDGMRGLAIMGVILIHVGQLVPGLPGPVDRFSHYGARGVQLFFVVSGLTLTLNHAGRPLSLGAFWIRRFFRIAPMFYLGAVFYLLLGQIGHARFATIDATPLQIGSTFLLLHGWLPDAINKVVPGGWSIADEVMFYLIFPALMVLLAYRRRLFLAAVALSFPLAVIVSLAIRHLLPGDPALVEGFGYSFWLCQLPAFATGCGLSILLDRFRHRPRRFGLAMAAAAGLGLIVASQLPLLSNHLVADILFGALVLGAGLSRPRWIESRFMVATGKVSFSIYLVHFAIVSLVETGMTAAIIRTAGPVAALLIIYIGVYAAAMAIATATYRWIELPMIAVGRTVSRRFAPRDAPVRPKPVGSMEA
jgi:peptidoglycan/LPS O-acetylase OafA/YrhL